MEPILYSSAQSATNGFARQTITANNVANINTPGFKSDLYHAQTLYLQGDGVGTATTQLQLANHVDLTPGPVMQTGRALDVALEGNAFFAVQANDGAEAYTQAGNFQITANGQLVTGSGRPVLGDGGPIAIPPAQNVVIGSDGTISVVPLEGGPDALAVIDRLKLVKLNDAQVYKTEEGLLRTANGATLEADAGTTVVNGALNGSNANPVEQLVLMIEENREYEENMKFIQSVDENQNRLARLLQE